MLRVTRPIHPQGPHLQPDREQQAMVNAQRHSGEEPSNTPIEPFSSDEELHYTTIAPHSSDEEQQNRISRAHYDQQKESPPKKARTVSTCLPDGEFTLGTSALAVLESGQPNPLDIHRYRDPAAIVEASKKVTFSIGAAPTPTGRHRRRPHLPEPDAIMDTHEDQFGASSGSGQAMFVFGAQPAPSRSGSVHSPGFFHSAALEQTKVAYKEALSQKTGVRSISAPTRPQSPVLVSSYDDGAVSDDELAELARKLTTSSISIRKRPSCSPRIEGNNPHGLQSLTKQELHSGSGETPIKLIKPIASYRK